MHAKNKFLLLIFNLIFSNLVYSNLIEKVFEGQEGLHYYKVIGNKANYKLAPYYNLAFNKTTTLELFLLNERLISAGLDISQNELVLYEPTSRAVYYKGRKANYEEVLGILSKRKVSSFIYELTIKVKRNKKDEYSHIYSGLISPMKAVKLQNLDIILSCNGMKCEINLNGAIMKPFKEKAKIDRSILVNLNNTSQVIFNDDESGYIYEISLGVIGELNINKFECEKPKDVFKKIKTAKLQQ